MGPVCISWRDEKVGCGGSGVELVAGLGDGVRGWGEHSMVFTLDPPH